MNFVGSKIFAKKEFKNADVWDKRCKKSLQSMAIAVSEKHCTSFSSACGKTLRQCGSRIFSSNKMTTDKIQIGHYQETAKRASKEEVVLVAQDTTSFNYSGHHATTGLGHIGTKRSSKGIHMHTALALTVDGLPLGIIGQTQWVRKEAARGKKHKRKILPIGEKESYKWIDGMEWVKQRMSRKIKQIWLISDRESDVYEYMSMERPENIHILLRATQPRIIEAEIQGQSFRGHLTDIVKDLPKIAEKEVEITRENRSVKLSLAISCINIKLLPPASKGKTAESLDMSLIYATEIGAEGKKEKVEWILLSDKQDLDAAGAILMVDYYTQRWKVERFHYTLKTGVFDVEKLQFDDAHTLMNALSFYSIMAWHTLWVIYYSRLEPEAKAEVVIDATEKAVLEALTGKKIGTVLQAMMAIGILGGFLSGSKRYPYPGIKVMWVGITTLMSMKQGWLLAKRHTKKKYAT